LVKGLAAKAGDIVKQGDVFCTIDDTDTQQAVKDAQYALQQKEIALQGLELQLTNLNIMAPIDGTVKSVYVSPGDDINSTKPAYGGMAIITAGADGDLEIPVPFPSSGGKIAEVDVKAGQTVKKGDMMFKLDPSTIQNSIDQQNSQIEQAKEDLQNKEDTLNKSTVITPVSGVVSVLNIKNGQMLENSQIALIATVTDTSKMEIQLPVDELDINKLQLGQKATIKIDDIPGKEFTGQVESISQNGTVTNNVTNYNVVVSVDNPDSVKIGMNANVSIAIQSKENVLAVPSEAIITRNSKKYIMIASNNQPQGNSGKNSSSNSSASGRNNSSNGKNNSFGGKLVPVETGLKTATMTEITSGVTEGETILIQLPQSTTSNSSAARYSGGMGSKFGGGR
jgi:HlyD family secretion protein